MNRLHSHTCLAALLTLSLVPAVSAQNVEWTDLPLSDNTWFDTDGEFRQGQYQIPLAAGEALEYKLEVGEGDVIVYEWTVDMSDSSLLEVEFHGHTEPVDGEGTVMFYKVHNEGSEQGSLRAPFSGIHGWYLNNTSAEDIVINLSVAGFYNELD